MLLTKPSKEDISAAFTVPQSRKGRSTETDSLYKKLEERTDGKDTPQILSKQRARDSNPLSAENGYIQKRFAPIVHRVERQGLGGGADTKGICVSAEKSPKLPEGRTIRVPLLARVRGQGSPTRYGYEGYVAKRQKGQRLER